MNIQIRPYQTQDAAQAAEVWNQVVEDGLAFPQEENLTAETGDQFFKEQTYTGIAVNTENNEIVGLYILHPNNVGRCGHICNASYAVLRDIRGQHIGEKLVFDCLAMAKENGFRIMQFNAVVASNTHALHLYERIGFTKLGVIPGGFRMPDGHYEDIIPHYYVL
ncbi:N-acetyltransferase family protein [Eubacterium ramulus]